jgi:tetratricopeptide (TPR) repeat protein
VLNGSVTVRGDDLSLYVELIDAASTKVIWSRQYNRKQSDIVSLQSDIARDLSNTLRPTLSNNDEKKVTREYTANPEAYRLFLLGNSLRARRKLVDVQKAVDCYEQAIALDPNYALAYAGLAGAHVFMTIYGGAPGGQEFPKARAAAEKALEIEPNLPTAISALAIISVFYDHDFTAFERQQNKAIELSPNNGEFHRQIGIRQAWLGRFDEAVAEFKRSLELEPMLAVTHVNLGWTYYFAGKINESDAELAMALEIDPTLWFTHYQMFINAMTKGEYSVAVEHLAKAHELRDDPESAKFMRDAFARGGWRGFVQAAVDEPEKSKLLAYPRATLAMELGDKEKALAALNEDYEKYDQFIYFLKIDPKMQPLHGDPRYDELLKKLGIPQ